MCLKQVTNIFFTLPHVLAQYLWPINNFGLNISEEFSDLASNQCFPASGGAIEQYAALVINPCCKV